MKKLERIIILFFVVLFTVLAFTGCSVSKSNSPKDESGYKDGGDYYNKPSGSDYDKNGASSEKNTDIAKDSYERKVIRNAFLDVRTKDAVGLYKEIVKYCTSIGGYENNYSIDSRDDYVVINVQFKVTPEKLQDFVNFVSEKGTVVSNTLKSDDITDSYYDTVTRLETKRRSLEQYYTLLAKAKTIEEIVYVQKIIDGITEDIEAMEGRLNVWNSQTEMATVTIYITQIFDPVIPKKEIHWNTISWDDMGYLIKEGFYTVSNVFISLIQWLVIILIGYSPLWIVLAVVGFVLVKVLNKKAKKPLVKKEEGKEILGDQTKKE